MVQVYSGGIGGEMHNRRKQFGQSLVAGNEPRWLENMQHWVLPLSFLFPSFLNLGFFYLGLAFEDNPIRSMGYMIGCILFAVFSALVLAYAILRNPPKMKQSVLWCEVLLFFGGCFLYGLICNGFDSYIFRYAKVFIVLVIPAYFAGSIAGLKRTEQSFFGILERLGFFALPVTVVYVIWAIFDCNPFHGGRYLGFMNYMSYAYTIMPILLAMILQFSESAPMKLPFVNRTVPHVNIVRGTMIVIYWLAIIATGARGAYICVAAFCALLVLSKWIKRQKAKHIFRMSVALAMILALLMFVYTPPGFRGVGRMTDFLQNLLNGQFSTSDMQQEDVYDQLENLLNATTPTENVPSATTVMESPATEPPDAENVISQISDRGTMYKLAVGEFLKAPLFGMGPGGYSEKYQGYPHNLILELLCETGIVGTLIVCVFAVIAVWNIWGTARKEDQVLHLLIFFAVYLLQANMSGSVWQGSALLYLLGYGFALPQGGRCDP